MRMQYLLKFNITAKRLLLALTFLVLLPCLVHASQTRTVTLNDETEIEITVDKAKGDTLFLWLYSEAGPQKADEHIAKQLVKNNIEVWRPDLFAAHFLPVATSSMDRIPETDFSFLIEYAFQQTGKKIIPVSTGRGSLPVLRGARHWQLKRQLKSQSQQKNNNALTGVILMSPKFFIETPEPGVKAELLPIVKHTNLPIFILQPEKSPWYWKLDQTIPVLEKSGSDVFVQRIKDVRDRYYFRPDANEIENKQSQLLALTLKRAANYLKSLPYKKRDVVKANIKQLQIQLGKKERKLKIYQGNPLPPALKLKNLHNKFVDIKKLKGQVILVNFWASWCPPCVHEMPSMQRLQSRFSNKPFTILGVNMAEEEKTIRHFLKTKVKINFPVLLDIDGAALKSWGVFAFPTSYVIDKKGQIRYALFGGVDWETKDIVKKISALINEE